MLLTIVALYLAALLGIGWWSQRRLIGGMTDFLLAGRRLGLLLCAGTMAATHFGGGALLGGASYGFTHGVSGAWYGIATGVGLLCLSGLTAGRFRGLALYTVPDYLAMRYGGRAIRVLGAMLSLVALVGILAAQVTAAGSAFAIVGFDATPAAVTATLVFILYTAAGGLWAATITDLFQIAVAGAGVVIAAGVVAVRMEAAGGFAAALAARGVGDGYFSLTGIGGSTITWLLLPTVMYTLIGQDFYQRLFAARDATVARHSALAGGVFLIALSLAPVMVGMGARGLSDLEDPTRAVPWVLQNLLHPLFGGIVLAAILAAIMSTADSLLTAATSHVVKDLWIETFRVASSADERRLLAVSRASTVVVGIAALAIALAVPGIVTLLIYSYTIYTAAIFVPLLGGFLWGGATRAGALTAVSVGTAVALGGIATGADLLGIPTEIYAALGSAVTFVVVSVATAARHRRPARRK
jgi:SSS family solute:Na+ symporter